MTRTEVAGIAAIVASSSAAGWFVRDQATEPHGPESVASPAPALASGQEAALPSSSADSVIVFGDGTVAIQLRKAPLSWLLDEIVRQGGQLPSAVNATAASLRVAAAPASCQEKETDEPPAPEAAAKLVQALREGNEAQRFEALSRAMSDDVAVPEELLRQLVDADPSDRIRLAAFKAYADASSNDAELARAALEVGRYNQSEAVQAEARNRIEEFERAQAMQPVNDPQRHR